VAAGACDAESDRQREVLQDRFGVTAVAWPESFADIDAILEDVPSHVGAMTMLEPEDRDLFEAAGFDLVRIEYKGGADSASLNMTNLREPGMAPRLAIGGLFLMVDRDESLRCVEGSYAGSIDVADDGEGGYPGPREADLPDEGLAWFDCDVERTEGDRRPAGHVVGWFRGEVVCVVRGSSPAVLEQVVDELAAAWQVTG